MSERDLTAPPNQTMNQPSRRRMVVRQLHFIAVDNPFEFQGLLGSLHEVDKKSPLDSKDMPSSLAVRTAIGKGGQGQTIQVKPMVLEVEEGPFITQDGKVGLGRFQLQELILVGRTFPASLDGVFEEITSPRTVTSINPPYPPQWNIIEGEVKPTTENLTPQITSGATNSPNNFIRPLTDAELKKAA